MTDRFAGAEDHFEVFSGLEDGFGSERRDGSTPRTSPILPGVGIEPVAGSNGDMRPFYERGMGREEEDEILAQAMPVDGGLSTSFRDEQKAWETERAWDQHLGTDSAGADLYH